ncbi:MAG: hypothetical protein AUJ71_04435 [Candidatus Omnitrophica bacterium CG1_02_49_16]|nr:MAG: hypothetical protein AUJ71_04435 [Candidatus Omnitrophica bacterium CG1_02_49_16]
MGGAVQGGHLSGGDSFLTLAVIEGQNWGIFGAVMGGNFLGAPENGGEFSVTLTGDVRNNTADGLGGNITNEYSNTVWFGKLTGTRDTEGAISGELDSVWISVEDHDAFLKTGTIKGDAVGNSSAESAGTWQAVATGDFANKGTIAFDQVKNFIENTKLLTSVAKSQMSLNTAITSSAVTAANANFTFYGASAGATSGIWAAFFNGTVTDFTGLSAISFSNTPNTDVYSANLNNIQWNADTLTWNAQVDGSGGSKDFKGAAAGTFVNPAGQTAGSFTGAGVGNWKEQQPPPQPT